MRLPERNGKSLIPGRKRVPLSLETLKPCFPRLSRTLFLFWHSHHDVHKRLLVEFICEDLDVNFLVVIFLSRVSSPLCGQGNKRKKRTLRCSENIKISSLRTSQSPRMKVIFSTGKPFHQSSGVLESAIQGFGISRPVSDVLVMTFHISLPEVGLMTSLQGCWSIDAVSVITGEPGEMRQISPKRDPAGRL